MSETEQTQPVNKNQWQGEIIRAIVINLSTALILSLLAWLFHLPTQVIWIIVAGFVAVAIGYAVYRVVKAVKNYVEFLEVRVKALHVFAFDAYDRLGGVERQVEEIRVILVNQETIRLKSIEAH